MHSIVNLIRQAGEAGWGGGGGAGGGGHAAEDDWGGGKATYTLGYGVFGRQQQTWGGDTRVEGNHLLLIEEVVNVAVQHHAPHWLQGELVLREDLRSIQRVKFKLELIFYLHGLDVQLPLRELTCRQVTHVKLLKIIMVLLLFIIQTTIKILMKPCQWDTKCNTCIVDVISGQAGCGAQV